MSLRNSLRGTSPNGFSHSGFQQLPGSRDGPSSAPNDASISIPMEPVRSTSNKTSGSRRAGDRSPALNAPSMPTSGQNMAANFDEKMKSTERKHKKAKGDGTENDPLTVMGRIYETIKNFSIVTRYLLYVLPVSLILAIPIFIITPNSIGKIDQTDGHSYKRLGGVRLLWVFVWIIIFWLAIWVSKLVAKALPAVFQFICGVVSPGVRKYKIVIEQLEIPISLCLWMLAAYVTFTPMMSLDAWKTTGQGDSIVWSPVTGLDDLPWANNLSHVLLALLICCVILLGEKAFIQVISISYHHTQYDEKIRGSKHNVDIICLLYEASISLFPAYCPEFAEEDYLINDSIELPRGLAPTGGNSNNRAGSATPMRLIQNVGRFGDKVTAAFGNIASEVTGKQVFNPMASHSIIVEALEKKRSSEALARRIWMSLVVEGRDALYLDDVQEVLSGHSNTDAEQVFAVLDKDGNGDVSLDEMIMTIVEFGRERKSIATSLHDVDQAIKVLDRLLLAVVLLIAVLVFILVLSPTTGTSLAGAGTALLSTSFIFAVTCQEVLGSCIFLFVKHPFDVGDRVEISSSSLTVERISLLYTIFKNINSGQNTQVPNILLNTLWIDNLSRSHAMREKLLFNISFDTSLEDIELLRGEMTKFVIDKDNSRDFDSEILIELTGVNNMASMELKVEIRHKSNWHNETLRAARRSKFLCALVLALRKIPVVCPGGGDMPLGSADQPSYSVAVSRDDAVQMRQAFKDRKAVNKLSAINAVATAQNGPDPGSATTGADANQYLSPNASMRQRNMNAQNLAPASEMAVVQSLNARSPAQDQAHDYGNKGESVDPVQAVVTNPRSLVHADSQRQRDLAEVYDVLHRQPSGAGQNMGKRRESYQMNVYAPELNMTQRGQMPAIREPHSIGSNIRTPVSGSSSPDGEDDFGRNRIGTYDHAYDGSRDPGTGARRRAGSPTGQAYSPLNKQNFDDNVFGSGWDQPFVPEPFWPESARRPGQGQGQPGGSPQTAIQHPPRQFKSSMQAAGSAGNPPGAPPKGAQRNIPAQQPIPTQQAPSYPQAPPVPADNRPRSPVRYDGESWFERDSVAYSPNPLSPARDEYESRGANSARASSIALAGFGADDVAPRIPSEPMPITPGVTSQGGGGQTPTRPGTSGTPTTSAAQKIAGAASGVGRTGSAKTVASDAQAPSRSLSTKRNGPGLVARS